MIDWRRIDDLQTEIGPDGLAEVAALFLEEVDSIVARLGTAPNPATYEADMHFLKGCAWNLGFAEFGALCQGAEKQAAAGRPGDVDLGRIIDNYVASKKAFVTGLAARAATVA